MIDTAEARYPSQPPAVILGASGDVGRRLAKRLASVWQGRLILAGRRTEILRSTATQIGGHTEICEIDASRDQDANLVPEGSVLVSLTEAATPGFVSHCLDRGATYIDSSATQDYTSALATVSDKSRRSGRLVLYAGFMPGLTNALADAMATRSPNITRLNIIVQLGLGRHHGDSATEWTFREAGREYQTWSDGRLQTTRPGALSRRYRYRGTGSLFFASGFGSVDQLVAGRRNRLRDCHTFLTFDTIITSALFASALKLGVGPLMKKYSKALTSMLKRLPAIGSIGTRFGILGYGTNGELLSRWDLAGGDQADITALMLAETVQASQWVSTSVLSEGSLLVDAKSALRALANAGLLDSTASSLEFDANYDVVNAASN